MTKMLFTILALFTSTAMASTTAYDMKFDLSLDGKPAASGQIVSKADEKATVYRDMEGGKTFIEVVATEGEIQGHKGILMNFVVGRIEKNGKKVVLSKPQVLAKENETAEMTVGDERNQEAVKLSVVATRKSR